MPYSMFSPQIGRQVITERVAVGERPGKRQKYAGHTQSWVPEWPSGEGQPAEREPRCGDQRVGIENPHEYQVDEETFDAGLARREVLVFEVRADDADVVCPVPALGGRIPDELERRGDRRSAGGG